jgi:hypothetical protein
VHFQIKGREWRTILWLINSRIDIGLGGGASEGEIEGGEDSKGRELGVEEKERIWEGWRRRGHPWEIIDRKVSA